MSGYIDNLSDSQRNKLEKLKQNVKDILEPDYNDVLLLNFLRARRFDLKKTEVMFRKDVEWRKEHRISTILQWYEMPEILKNYWAGGICGLSREGHVVYMCPAGNFDPKGILYSAKASDILTTFIYHLELIIAEGQKMAAKKGMKPADGAIVIFDLESLGLHHLWKPGIDLFTKTAIIGEQHYPELIHKVLIIRAPKIFPVTYALVKPFMREDTRQKIDVLGSNWKEEVLKLVEPDQLPVYWGGTLKDPDGNEQCPSLIKLGGMVPKSYYLKDREPPHTLTTHEVSRGGVVEFKYDVKHANSVLRYEFQTDCADIKFGVDRVDGKQKTTIMKQEKFNSHMVPENGEIMIAEPGIYIVRFDNTHSWTKSKKLSYWIEVLEQTDTEPEFDEMLEETERITLKG